MNDDDELEREYFRAVGMDHPSSVEFWMKLVEPEEREVRTLFTRELLLRMNEITRPHLFGSGATEMLFRLGLWVWTARSSSGDFYEKMRERRKTAKSILPRLKAHTHGLKAALRQASALNLIDDVDGMIDQLEDWSDNFRLVEKLSANPLRDGTPGLRMHRELIMEFALSWHLTTGEPPRTSVGGKFQQYVDIMLELIPADCRPRWIAPTTLRDWAKQYRALVKNGN